MNSINEQWKPVKDFENYEVSNFGRVKSLNYNRTGVEKIMRPQKNRNGYLYVGLRRNGKRKMLKVHRLVAIAFIPNPEGLPEVNHLNEDKTNNVVENLEWVSRRYNVNFGTRNERIASAQSKSVEASKYEDFREICLRFSSMQEAERNGYYKGNVSACCNGCYSAHRGNFYKNLYWRFAV